MYKSIGIKIKKMRKSHNYSINDVLRLLTKKNEPYSPQTIYKWEEGTSTPSIYALKALSEIYECSITYFLDDTILTSMPLSKREHLLLKYYREDMNFKKIAILLYERHKQLKG